MNNNNINKPVLNLKHMLASLLFLSLFFYSGCKHPENKIGVNENKDNETRIQQKKQPLEVADGLHYLDTKQGDKILLLVHGVMMTHEIWEKQIEYFSANYRVIAMDLHGFGKSKALDRENLYEEHASDLKKLIDSLQIKKVHLMGWSLGGGVSIKFASMYPENIEKLVLVGTTPKLIGGDDFEFGMPEAAAAGFIELLETNYQKGIEEFVKMQLPEKNNTDAYDVLMCVVPQTNKEVALKQLRSTGNVDLRPDVKKIKCPTLVINGELDSVCSPKAGEYMANLIPNGQFQILPKYGHAVFMTASNKYNQLVGDFLKIN